MPDTAVRAVFLPALRASNQFYSGSPGVWFPSSASGREGGHCEEPIIPHADISDLAVGWLVNGEPFRLVAGNLDIVIPDDHVATFLRAWFFCSSILSNNIPEDLKQRFERIIAGELHQGREGLATFRPEARDFVSSVIGSDFPRFDSFMRPVEWNSHGEAVPALGVGRGFALAVLPAVNNSSSPGVCLLDELQAACANMNMFVGLQGSAPYRSFALSHHVVADVVVAVCQKKRLHGGFWDLLSCTPVGALELTEAGALRVGVRQLADPPRYIESDQMKQFVGYWARTMEWKHFPDLQQKLDEALRPSCWSSSTDRKLTDSVLEAIR